MRHVRISDDLWEAIQEAVKLRGDPSVSHIIREALAAYVRQTQRMQRAEQQGAARVATNRGANLERRNGRRKP